MGGGAVYVAVCVRRMPIGVSIEAVNGGFCCKKRCVFITNLILYY